MALELSCSNCCASGEGAADEPELAPEVADEAADPEVADVEDVAVEFLFPHPVMTVATTAAANTIATDGRVQDRQETRRWEICACEIKPFMASLC
ncbi:MULTISPECIES: hypothetical protein [Mycobacterium]|uniref:hypothetical protein n=1 Tax=Mycobacterium TaxID=1763 RepID=UPI0025A4049F|nr:MULTISPECIES: hypothetical protein [Mycobacterium]